MMYSFPWIGSSKTKDGLKRVECDTVHGSIPLGVDSQLSPLRIYLEQLRRVSPAPPQTLIRKAKQSTTAHVGSTPAHFLTLPNPFIWLRLPHVSPPYSSLFRYPPPH